MVLISGPLLGMQSTALTSSLIEDSALLTKQLTVHAREIQAIRSSLWPFKGLLVYYQNRKLASGAEIKDQVTLDHHNNSLKSVYQLIIKECDKACHALANRDLQLLAQHTQTAQRFYSLFDAEVRHFKHLVAKKFPRANM